MHRDADETQKQPKHEAYPTTVLFTFVLTSVAAEFGTFAVLQKTEP